MYEREVIGKIKNYLGKNTLALLIEREKTFGVAE
jgi:hypothetical protein